MQFIVSHQASIREIIDGTLMIMSLWCAAIISYYLVQLWAEGGDWRHAEGAKMACALWWVFMFEAYRTGSIWHVYFMAPEQRDVETFVTVSFSQTIGDLIGGVGLMFSTLYCSYLFSPPMHKQRLWKLSIMTATLFLVVTAAL